MLLPHAISTCNPIYFKLTNAITTCNPVYCKLTTCYYHMQLPHVIIDSSSSSRTDLTSHFQQPIASQPLFHSFTTFWEKRQDRRGWSRSLGATIGTTTTPQTLTDEKVGGGKKGGRASENSVTLTLIHTLKKKEEK